MREVRKGGKKGGGKEERNHPRDDEHPTLLQSYSDKL